MRVLYSGALNSVTGYGNDGIALCRALLRWGCDVYVQPSGIHPALPSEVAALLTKPIPHHVDLALTHRCPQELARPEASAPRAAATVSLAWSMWEWPDLGVADRISDVNCEHQPKVVETLAPGLASYDALLVYDAVSREALSPYHGSVEVLQGGVDAAPYVARDWWTSPFRFLMLGSLHAQPLWSRVLTPGGWVRMGDIAVGQLVCAPGGGWQKVEGISPRSESTVYEVSFTDGTSAVSSANHLWVVDRKTNRGGFCGNWQTLSLQEIIDRGIRHGNNRMFAVPVEAVDYEVRPDPVMDPYLMGALLGDGDSSSGVGFSCVEDDLVEELQNVLPSQVVLEKKPGTLATWKFKGDGFARSRVCAACGQSVLRRAGRGLCNRCYCSERSAGRLEDWPLLGQRAGRSVMRELLERYEVSRLVAPDKFVPDDFLYGSREVRLAVLQGLMDTDGWNSTSQTCFSSSSPALVSAVAWLVRSLGGVASVSEPRRPRYRYKYKEKDEIRYGLPHQQVSFHLPFNPFRLPRKGSAWRSPDVFEQKVLSKRIESVHKLSLQEVQCITVSGESGTYITDDFTVTHNSRKNPMASVQAFKQLRDAGELADAELVLKTVVPGLHPAMEQWCPGLRIIAEVWPLEDLDRLMADSHVLLAPSRGEGKNIPAVRFGMSGGSVAATNVGGHAQWLSPEIGYPLPFEWLASLDGTGAEVDPDRLAEIMLAIYSDRGQARQRAERAAAVLPAMLAWDRVIERLSVRLEPLCGSRGAEVATLLAAARRNAPDPLSARPLVGALS